MITAPSPQDKPTAHRSRLGFLDTFIVILISSAVVIFLLWAATRTAGLNSFEILPNFLAESYRAIWISLVSGASGIGLAIIKVLSPKKSGPLPNYFMYVLGTTIGMLTLIVLLRIILAPKETRLEPDPSPSPFVIRADKNLKDNLVYVKLPAGSFLMGCSPKSDECENNEIPLHPVRITKEFWIGQTPVTQLAYRHVMETYNSRNSDRRNSDPSYSKGDQKPVENVSWFDAKKYCELVGMRLPTEAEWEYAARAGYPGSPRYGDIDAIAWYVGNSGLHTHAVMQKRENDWQLYDMLGNVWQWTADWYEPNYYSKLSLQVATGDPQGPTSPPSGPGERVLRGGGCFSHAKEIRFASRYSNVPNLPGHDNGFRCAGPTLP